MSGLLDQYFPSPSLPVQAFRALEDVLRADPVLASIPINWDVRRGDRGETMPPAPRQMPWVALVPLEMPMQRESEMDDAAKFRVRIDIAVEGTCWDDLANLAMAVRDALAFNKPFNADVTVEEYICKDRQGINRYYYKQGGVGVRRTETPPVDSAVSSPPPIADQVAAAFVEFDIFLPTIV